MYVNHLNRVPVSKDICEVESENPWSLPDVTNYKTIKHETQVLRMTQFKTRECAIKKVKKDILLYLVENKWFLFFMFFSEVILYAVLLLQWNVK